MSPFLLVGFGMFAFLSALASDYLETRYVRSVQEFERAADAQGAARARERAAWCSVSMWVVGMLALVAVLEVGWWVFLPEGLGLYIGTKLALRRRSHVSESVPAEAPKAQPSRAVGYDIRKPDV